ncbi:MAG: toll/interleukin-1 receptor domain-containing protein [Erythrobacter sp.]|nr:toll/interleukin-1 receptor domain-containing protein [Erythrobacter sp.]
MEYDAGETNSVETANEQRFSAFISYSHADAATVRKLHSQLESYRMPKGLGGIDALNRKRGGIGKVFRDRDDLSAAQDLSAAVKDALERSAVLVVACSPDAKASQWVDQEIAYFRERHPDRPILAAILRGEPQEAFPAALTDGGTEPLAADLRKEGDGWRLGFLKVVAGIAGVPLDRLVQRDSQRQLRRVMAVTGLFALFAIAMGVMTTIALNARNEAERQRVEAEGLVEYMIEDLRPQLRSVGRMDFMQGVNDRALEYFNNQGELSELPPKSQLRLATVLLAVGESNEARGELEAAKDRFEEAHKITAQLLSEQPNDPERIYAHAQSEYWVGYAAWREVKPEVAGPHWQAYADLSARLLAFDPSNVDWIMEAGYAASNIGLVKMRGEGDYVAAAALFAEALEFFQQAEARAPGNKGIARELADAHAWVADAHRAGGEFEVALEHRARERKILEKLAKAEPENAQFQSDLVGNAIGTAQAEIDAGHLDKARKKLREIQGRVRRLADAFPNNEKLQLQERVVGLLLVKADPDFSVASIETLRTCVSDELVSAEAELATFCSVLRQRAGMGGEGEAGVFNSAFPNMHLSPRWGLELRTN